MQDFQHIDHGELLLNITACDLRDDDYEGWADLCDDLISLCDDIPVSGSAYANSVADKLESIGESIRNNEHATDGQRTAITNMEWGISKWIRD